jgi:hypothetical protein
VALNDNLQNQEIKFRATNLTSSLWKIMGCAERSIIQLDTMGCRSDHLVPFEWIDGVKVYLRCIHAIGYKKGFGREYETKDGRMKNMEGVMVWTKMIFLLINGLCKVYYIVHGKRIRFRCCSYP